MELRKANKHDFIKINNAVSKKNIPFCRSEQICSDFVRERLYAVVEEDRVLATLSVIEEPSYGYMAIKRLCILNKKNQGKGIARFAIHEIQKIVTGRIGATPWNDNDKMRYLLESECFHLEYIFAEKWCFYVKECK